MAELCQDIKNKQAKAESIPSIATRAPQTWKFANIKFYRYLLSGAIKALDIPLDAYGQDDCEIAVSSARTNAVLHGM